MKTNFLFLLLLIIFPDLFAQKIVTGVIRDEFTGNPVPNVNILIRGTSAGTFTDNRGTFSIEVNKFPVILIISCIGYRKLEFELKRFPDKNPDLIIRPLVSTLKEVEIGAERYRYVFRDERYSVIDYEIMNGNLLLLVYKNQLKISSLVYLTLEGDTIATSPLPEQKPDKLFRDFLDNLQYVSTKGNAFMVYYNQEKKTLEFPHKISFEDLVRVTGSLCFTIGNRFYFHSDQSGGFGKIIGYVDTTTWKSTILSSVVDEKRLQRLIDDQKFDDLYYYVTNNPINENMYQASHSIDQGLRKPVNAPLVKLNGDTIAFFNFPSSKIELMNKDGKVLSSIPITFHLAKENDLADAMSFFMMSSREKWSGKILDDTYFNEVYTYFTKNGMVKISRIDLKTGKLVNEHSFSLPFPGKITVYRHKAYFLYQEIGSEYETRKLVSHDLY